MYNKSEGPYGNENIKEKMRAEKQENTNHNMLVGIIVGIIIVGGYFYKKEEESYRREMSQFNGLPNQELIGRPYKELGY